MKLLTFKVYQQLPPIETGKMLQVVTLDGTLKQMKEYKANLVFITSLEALSASAAIKKAKTGLPEFRNASKKTLAAYPIVEEVHNETNN
jgi:hypothetical protein